ncbi:MAG: methylenetetrahydrofolate reductase [Desulfuromonadales bacterium]
MSTLSIELVPRDRDSLQHELQLIRTHFPAIETINIPDLLKFPLRSWDACRQAKALFPHAIPHLRAIDFDLRQPFPLVDEFIRNELDTVLVIAGDQPQDMSRRVYRTSSIELIRVLRAAMPSLKIYAGIDPYRTGIKTELDYVKRKIDAGADGFFTQPFFDLRLMEIYCDLLAGLEVFWGISPVMSERSKDYWDNLNNAIFPPDFEPTLEWNRRLAKQAMAFAGQTGANIYFMPIRIDLVEYLQGIL